MGRAAKAREQLALWWKLVRGRRRCRVCGARASWPFSLWGGSIRPLRCRFAFCALHGSRMGRKLGEYERVMKRQEGL